jgi:hypothetical protein
VTKGLEPDAAPEPDHLHQRPAEPARGQLSHPRRADHPYDSGGRATEVMISVIAGDMASFCYDFPIPD